MSQHVFHPDGPLQLVMNPLTVKKYDGGMAKNQDAPFQEGNCVRTFGRSNHQLSISGTAKHRGFNLTEGPETPLRVGLGV
jgi:hypothetical protein